MLSGASCVRVCQYTVASLVANFSRGMDRVVFSFFPRCFWGRVRVCFCLSSPFPSSPPISPPPPPHLPPFPFCAPACIFTPALLSLSILSSVLFFSFPISPRTICFRSFVGTLRPVAREGWDVHRHRQDRVWQDARLLGASLPMDVLSKKRWHSDPHLCSDARVGHSDP